VAVSYFSQLANEKTSQKAYPFLKEPQSFLSKLIPRIKVEHSRSLSLWWKKGLMMHIKPSLVEREIELPHLARNEFEAEIQLPWYAKKVEAES